MEIAIALIVGFALGYGVREWVSRRRRPFDCQVRDIDEEVPHSHLSLTIRELERR
jgi:hypothetical protein